MNALPSYRNERPYPFCPGCGHALVLNQLDAALVALGADPKRTVLVTDIGCQGLADQYFVTNAFHGLHGRSIAYATGIKLADPGLTVIVLMGDGGTGIGGAHLLNAARRNIGLTVLVMNNFNFGMTGGEHSATTPSGGRTVTTRDGNLERPLDICATVAANGAGYVWRGTAFDRDLSDAIAAGVRSNSFALLDIWELCTAYYAPNNDWSRKTLIETREALGMAVGLLHREDRIEYAQALSSARPAERGSSGLTAAALPTLYQSPLDRQFSLVVAGSAGGKVRSAARMIGEAALLAGLHAAQQDDYPVTVQTGHSISEIILSPREILFTGIGRPDALVVATEDGRRAATRYLKAMTPKEVVFTVRELAALDTQAQKVIVDFESAGIRTGRKNLALLLCGAALSALQILPWAAFEEAAHRGSRAEIAEENLAALQQGARVPVRQATG